MNIHLQRVVVRIPGTGRHLFSVSELKIPAGERVLIQGPSGLGKTTLLHLIAGLFVPDEGRVSLGGVDVNGIDELERSSLRRAQMAIVFQRLNLISHLTALENVEVAMSPKEGRTAAGRQLAERALQRLHMQDHGGTLAANLSIGEQQRVAVARVLAVKPKLVLADEPTSNLDDANAAAVCDVLFSIPNESTLVVVSHDHRIQKRFPRVIDFTELAKEGR